MVKIRLMRLGKKKQPYYRVVVADSRSPRDGRFIENIGRYHPRSHPSVIEIDEDRALHWLQNGAQPSDPVKVLLQKTGVWGRFTGQPAPDEEADASEDAAAGAEDEQALVAPAAEAEGQAPPGDHQAEESAG